jgi:hypothetical protein
MTNAQKNTVDTLTKLVEKLNGKQTINTGDLRKGHIYLTIYNKIDKCDWIRTTTYADVEINTKGNVTKGFFNQYQPKEEVIYPYMD